MRDTPGDIDQILPLSPTQAGMLSEILSANTESRRYLSLQRVEFEGDIDPDAFRRIFEEEVLRHDLSRACFVYKGVARPLQIIRSNVKLPFGFQDQSADDTRESCWAVIEERLMRQISALDRAPLMAAELVKIAPSRHVLIWAIHHIISDGWSVSVLLKDIVRRLNGQSTDRTAGSVFKAHLTRLKARDDAADRAFWTRTLADLESPTLVAAAGSAPGAQAEEIGLTLPHDVLERIKEVARKARVTQATMLSAAWGLTLRRLTGQDDIVFGSVSSGRDPSIPGIEKAVGPYLSVVPARMRFTERLSVRELLHDAEKAANDRRPYEPAGLAPALGSIPGQRRLPFDSLFAVEVFGEHSRTGPVRITNMTGRDATGFPLALTVTPGHRLDIRLIHDPVRLPASTAKGILESYRNILQGFCAGLERMVAHVPGLPLPPVTPLPEAENTIMAIRAKSRDMPSAAALHFGDRTVSYRDLDRRAGALARRLQNAGIGPGDIVPIMLERSERAVIAMLGVLYSGAAYAPIDTAYPDERIAMILEDIGAHHVISDNPVPQMTSIEIPENGEDFDIVVAGANDPAYVIFTSGSTGRPKGVVVTQSNLSWTTAARTEIYGRPPTSFLHLSSFAFDSSVVGLYWTLTGGGSLVIAPPRSEQNADALMQMAARYGVTHLLALPRLWEAVLKSGNVPKDMSTVIVAGEAVDPQIPSLHRMCAPWCRLYNEYGPSEATVWCAAADITDASDSVAIGRAPPGAALDVCDKDGFAQPAGIEGELVVRGEGLARGYLNRPEETRRAFAGGRYRTGDWGVRDVDGALRFVGRIDDQVKIRGHRVELGELEAEARRAGAADAVAALAQGRLVLAVVGGQNIEHVLLKRLPSWMRPSEVYHCSRIPHLPNGKADRAAVAAMSRPDKAVKTAEPSGYFEETLAVIWGDVLKKQAGSETHFFDAGGDSLSSISVTALAEEKGIALRPNDIFDYPVLRDLADVLRMRARAPAGIQDDLITISNKDGTRRPFLMIYGNPSLYAGLRAALGEDRPLIYFFSHYFGGKLGLASTIEGFAAQSVAALRRIQPTGPYILGGYSLGAHIALEAAMQLEADGEKVDRLFLVDPTRMIAAPRGASEPLARRFDRALRALVSLTRIVVRARDQRFRVGQTLRTVIWRYRPPVWDGPALLVRTEAEKARPGPIDDIFPKADEIVLPFRHLELQNSAEAIETWTARLAAAINETDRRETK